MLALILAGGGGTRLDLGEKPLVTIRGKPMIEYVIDAFTAGGYDVVVVLSKKTPFTQNWCRAREILCIIASGAGYIEDLAEAVDILGIIGPFFTCVADLPCLRPGTIRVIEERYRESGCEACSVWVPRDISGTSGCRSSYSVTINGISACPAGINILRGDLIDRPQEELSLLIPDKSLSFNINTREELALIRTLVREPGNQ
ncbi:MAG TPA: NTP transferase domain-containing protein [Methanoregulaceae archaeon]|nr:MAG: NTP transferase domain-containing protein [Methanolinea sp.]HON80888.1 NTP transferase domain-containing protein [Methanoregulaceae archaeon]HPD09625.1 NTP transferase domain-containing protein [Methanoregulaceae archaeon]HRT15294.1 NTP transferase domain-containing protein [Methanoregulaceae archaeon]HRU30865.1 NTP transferase domain-containing protein [Methanoregulaceae archaeon]